MFRRNFSFPFNYLTSLLIMAGMIYSFLQPLNCEVSAASNTLPTPATAVASPEARKDLSRKPLLFEENRGQAAAESSYIMRSSGYTLYLGKDEAKFAMKYKKPGADKPQLDTVTMKFSGAGSSVPVAEDEAVTKSHYYLKGKAIENVPSFKKVRYANIYKGIDALFYDNNGAMEYDMIVQPGSDPAQIGFAFEGASSVQIEKDGSLSVKTVNTGMSYNKPFSYQEIDGERREVESRYEIRDGKVGFVLGEYDRSKPLVVDPVLKYLSYLAGSKDDAADAVDMDAAGNLYLVGTTFSPDFPGTPNEAFSYLYVTKLSPDGGTVLYNFFTPANISSTSDIDVDPAGNAYVAGGVRGGFETTPGVAQEFFPDRGFGYNICIGSVGFMMKLNVAGTREFSTYHGGNCGESIAGIAVHPNGRIYVAGSTSSNEFPLKNEYQGTPLRRPEDLPAHAFLTVFNSNATGYVYSTLLNGRNNDVATDVGIDSLGNAYIVGRTDSNNFPVKSAFQDEFKGGGSDAFLAKFNPNLSGENSLIFSTYFGGSGTDRGNAIAVNPNTGKVYITGITGSVAGSFPLLNALDSTNQVNEAFVSIFTSSGGLTASTFLGGNATEEGLGIALDSTEAIHVVGKTSSADFPVKNPLQPTRQGASDAFLTKLRFNGTFSLLLSTFIGGNQGDFCRSVATRAVQMWAACGTGSIDLPVSANALDSTIGGDGEDGFIFRMVDKNEDTIGVFNPGLLQFQLKNSIAGGAADITVNRGAAGDVPVKGDFNGDGIDTVSTFNNGTWSIRNTNITPPGYPTPATIVSFGQAGDIPVTGDWNGDGIDTLGVFRPADGRFFLSNSLTNPQPDITVIFGVTGDLPVAGDWNGDGIDSVGVFRASSGEFFLTDDNSLRANVDIGGVFGTAEDLPVAGDFDGDGRDSFGVWRPSIRTFFLTNNNVDITATAVFGQSGDRPLTGDWDGEAIP